MARSYKWRYESVLRDRSIALLLVLRNSVVSLLSVEMMIISLVAWGILKLCGKHLTVLAIRGLLVDGIHIL